MVQITRVDESRELRLHRADGSGDPVILEHASGAEFSSDGRWLAYRQGVSKEEEEAAEARDELRAWEAEEGEELLPAWPTDPQRNAALELLAGELRLTDEGAGS